MVRIAHNRLKIIPGERFNRLKVIKEVSPNAKKQRRFLCQCNCGQKTIVKLDRLRNGITKSCGCIRKEMGKKSLTTHGLYSHPLYMIWAGMKSRCYNSSNSGFENYGGRGITVCPQWLNNFPQFLKDMGERPGKHSIDRIDNNGNYSPDNCRWATIEVQMRNRSNVKLYDYKGQSLCLSDISTLTGIKRTTLWMRLYRYNQSPQEAFEII